MKKCSSEIKDIKNIKRISIALIDIIILVSIIAIVLNSNKNNILKIFILILVYINIRLLIGIFTRNFRVFTIWSMIEKTIIDIENKEKSIDESFIVTINENEIKGVLGRKCWRLFDGLKKLLEKATILEHNIKRNEEVNINLVDNIALKLDSPLKDILDNVDNLERNNVNAKKSLEHIQEKSILIKSTIEELFEVSSIDNGDINTDFNKIEMKSLVKQVLIEYEDKIGKTEIIFKVKLPRDKVYIYADGEKIWRVLQLLIDNALKHSLKDSRIYFSLEENQDNAIITIKNTSKIELNIKPEKLINRIEENSNATGLSLEIIKKLIEVQGGSFELDIEADLFKVKLAFPIIEKEEVHNVNL